MEKEKDYYIGLEDREIMDFGDMLSKEEKERILQGVLQRIEKAENGETWKRLEKAEEQERNRNRDRDRDGEGMEIEIKEENGLKQEKKKYQWKYWKVAAAAIIAVLVMPSGVSLAEKVYKSISDLPIIEKISKVFQSKAEQDGCRLDFDIQQGNADEKTAGTEAELEEDKKTKADKKTDNDSYTDEGILMKASISIKNIHLNYPKMPDYNIKETENGEYNFDYKDGFDAGKDFSFELIAVDQAVGKGLFVDDIAVLEELSFYGNKGYYIELNNVAGSQYIENTTYTKRILVFYEEEGYMIQLYSMAGVKKKTLVSFVEGITLEECKKKEASRYTTMSEYLTYNIYKAKDYIEPETLEMIIRDDQVVSLHQAASRSGIEYEVQNVEVLDNISKLWEDNGKGFSDSMGIWEKRFEYADKKGNLKSYLRETIEWGDGITKPQRKVIARENIFQKFVLVELRVKNSTEQEREADVCLNMSYLIKKGEEWSYDDTIRNYNRKPIVNDCQLDHDPQYFKETNGEAGFYFKKLAPKEEEIYHIGYFVDEDLLDSMFLSIDGNVFVGEYSGTMIDIRQ